MRYLIDSDNVIYQLAGNAQAVQSLRQLAPEGIALSAITFMEVYQGLLRSPDPRAAQARFDTFLRGVPILPLTVYIARRCAELRGSSGSKASGSGRARSTC